MDMFADKVRTFIEENNLISAGDKIIIGLSGGADSVCLFRILEYLKHEYRLSLYAVHVNHGIRKDDAVADERFAEELAGKYNIPFKGYCCSVKQIAKDMDMTVEEAGRHIRYKVFEEERLALGADKIAVAHHKNDQVETILFRMCRGTGIKGLLGMDAKRDNIIRPLMCLERNEIIEYLKNIGQDYREDITNRSTDYDRNRIRINVIPELESINSGAVAHIDALAHNLRQVYEWLDAETDRLYKEYVEEGEGFARVSCDAVLKIHEAGARELIRRMICANSDSLKDITTYHIDSVMQLASMETGKRISLPYGLCAEKEYNILIIKKDGECPEDKNDKDFEYIIYKEDLADNPASIRLDNIYLPEEKILRESLSINLSVKNYNSDTMDIPKNNCTKWFDYDKIKSKLSIRRPCENDYFTLCRGGTKKLKRHMIDCRIPRQYRMSVALVAEDSRILSVIGGRAGENYYVDDNTKTVLEISFE